MRLKNKTQLFFVVVMAALVVILTAFSALGFRYFALYAAEMHARSVAETVKVGLTESMIHGTIDKRQQFLSRLSAVPGVKQVRVVRGPAVIAQFGPGFAFERAEHQDAEVVLATGKERFEVLDVNDDLLFRARIPYIANDHGTPNCLQCHTVSAGTVLGAVAIDISLTEMRRQSLIAVALISLAVLLAALAALAVLRRMMNPLTNTALAVSDVTSQAVGGNFSGRIHQRSSDELGEIALNINHLMDFLDREVTTIRSRVGELMGHHINDGGNQLALTAEMVENLVTVSQFKQAIEEDQTKLDIYLRIAEVLGQKYDFKRFSIYEVAASKNRMTPVLIDGELGTTCRYCDPQITVDSSFCRARRTGHEVNAVEYPGLCTMFRPAEAGDTHICLPINQSGSAGCVVQMVISAEHSPLARLMTPFVAVYLREAGPVLEAKRLMEHLRENSLRDAMTGLYNRRFLEEYIGTLVSGTQRRKSTITVLMLDLDFFKQVNDTHGHEVGDKVLKTLADVLLRNVRSSDIAVRYGGEEFLLALMDTGGDVAMKVAEKIRAEVEATKVPIAGGMLQKTISIGVAEFPTDSDTFWQIVKFADVALYAAKSAGRNRVVRFTPEMWDVNAHY
ncbi:MAG: GGDEF domain-containing protein [Gammaproteobacteria bacterium]|nr:GGDEF domain-containing protein [Rhodocyclaceae bacterium]MBU3909342.1 GGDEF domain-containing protein [Gammaproteobacteria bacterium]MBU3988710.1 GGDEF domain-containing protein [Gammaproteobacteria bacterium]MBU4005498.1 GGDEF domain-containing protein [Gammaproteobacteria bacterium]MBU4020949.1 GGDEF domain-containing protein [Gammaproteobacteria bacterium]